MTRPICSLSAPPLLLRSLFPRLLPSLSLTAMPNRVPDLYGTQPAPTTRRRLHCHRRRPMVLDCWPRAGLSLSLARALSLSLALALSLARAASICRWVSPTRPTAGRQVCFADDDRCVALSRVASTSIQRDLLNATCDPHSPVFFKWGPPNVICDFSIVEWVSHAQSDPRTAALARIPGLATEFWADMQAVLMQGSWYLDSEKDVPALLAAGQPLPANYRIPMLLISSGLNRLRDLDNSSMQLLYSTTDNSGPGAWRSSRPLDADTAPDGSVVAFSGVDGQTGGKEHPLLSYCNPFSTEQAVNITNYDYASFSLNRDHALTYAGGDNPTLLVWELDSAGNQPFSGEWELVPSPMATFRQLACERHTGKLGMSAISYAYETTTRGVQSMEVEAQILRGLRAATDDDHPLQTPRPVASAGVVAT